MTRRALCHCGTPGPIVRHIADLSTGIKAWLPDANTHHGKRIHWFGPVQVTRVSDVPDRDGGFVVAWRRGGDALGFLHIRAAAAMHGARVEAVEPL